MLLPGRGRPSRVTPPGGGHCLKLTVGAVTRGRLTWPAGTGRKRPASARWRVTCSAGDPEQWRHEGSDLAPDATQRLARDATALKIRPAPFRELPCIRGPSRRK